MRSSSEIWIILPNAYGIINNIEDYQCSAPNADTLARATCPLSDVNGTYKLNISLKMILSTSLFTVKVSLTNPSAAASFTFSAEFKKNTFTYANAQASTNAVTIVKNDNLIVASDYLSDALVTLENIPYNSGENATYIFMIPQISFSTAVLQTDIFFPSTFSSNIGDEISCSLLQSTEIGIDFNFVSLLQMQTNLTTSTIPRAIPLYYSLPCEVLNNNVLTLSGMSTYYANTTYQYIYLFINGVVNPGSSSTNTFKITHSANGYLLWVYSDELTYHISTAPNNINIVSITPTDTTMG